MLRLQLVLVGVFCCFFSSFEAEPFNVYLMEITIYQDHEFSLLFTNYPEVYLSCQDDLPNVQLQPVVRVDELYKFRLGDIRATRVSRDGCVSCSLMESDGLAMFFDDTFGSWWMCQDDFAKTGSHSVSKAGEFLILFQCPDCIEEQPEVVPPAPKPEVVPPAPKPEVVPPAPKPEVVPPAPEPEEELEMAAVSSAEPELDDDYLENDYWEKLEAEFTDLYYVFTTAIERTPSDSDAWESGDVKLLQSEASDTAASGEGSRMGPPS